MPKLIQVPITRSCINDVKNILKEAQKQSYRNVNFIMNQAYWLIGQRIVLQEQNGKNRAGYGEKLIERLAASLNQNVGSGMSVANLKNCRQFYLAFPNVEKSYTLCSELTWSHLRMVMRLPTDEERSYYIDHSKSGNWSVRELQRNIRTDMFHRVVGNQLPNKNKEKNEDFVKDPYILEFLGIKPNEELTENDLERLIIDHLEKFLLEMGRGFSFVERQMHIKTETSDFYIDLVFYNYLLKCFVLVDLKLDKLKHEDIGQMDMYVRMFDCLKKSKDDNPTVGIIFCADKDDSMVKYSVLQESKQIFASKYKTILPTEAELSAELSRKRNSAIVDCGK